MVGENRRRWMRWSSLVDEDESQVLGGGDWKLPGTRCTDRLNNTPPELCASAYVRRDGAKIRKAGPLRKGFGCGLKRFHDNQDDNEDQQGSRYLIGKTIEFLGTGVAVGCEILNPTDKKSVQGRHGNHQRELGPHPARIVPAAEPNQRKTEQPGQSHGGIDDQPEKALLHDLESFRLSGAGRRVAVIDEEPRQIEHAC